ncbi:MAG: methyltransferase domain-containing protein [Candidatus Tritonobacter lacicola]|nr:methyltransferase domain-containing protein [Candidatus Tritonobacter lacicola]
MKKTISALKSVLKQEGLFKFIFVVCARLSGFFYFKYIKDGYFEMGNEKYKYFYHLYNATFRKERAVEIAIAKIFLENFKGKEILEVGNVLNYYTKYPHDVIDKYEKGDGVINEGIVGYDPGKKYDLIISISTLEHIGWDERPVEHNKVLKALKSMENLLNPGGEMLVTVPLGYNSDIDNLINEKKLNFTKSYFLKKISKDNKWQEVAYEKVKDPKYDFKFSRANEIFIGIFKNNPIK